MRYNREISARIEKLKEFFPAVVLTGARQTGKTTLLRNLFPSHRYVSLDVPSQAELAESDPATFLARFSPPVLIDEVQYAPALFRHLKVVIDRSRHTNGQFILTGSQKFTLMQAVSESLAGRVGVAELEGLSLGELGSDFTETVDEKGPAAALARGFYPQLWDRPEFPSHEYYQSYIATYLERDVRQILRVESLRDFERFVRACALRSGQLLNKSELARDVGIHHKTANDWLSVLAASEQISLLEPYFSNETKRIVKSPKLYLNDTGLLCALLGLREETIAEYANLGSIWETFVYSGLRKQIKNLGGSDRLWFYRDQRGLEVDFLIESAGKLRPVEVKWTQYPDKNSVRPIAELSRKLSNIGDGYLVARPDTPYLIGEVEVVNGLEAGSLRLE